jgi:hypothetical protein
MALGVLVISGLTRVFTITEGFNNNNNNNKRDKTKEIVILITIFLITLVLILLLAKWLWNSCVVSLVPVKRCTSVWHLVGMSILVGLLFSNPQVPQQ